MFSSLVLALVLSQAGAPQKLRWEPKIDIPVTGALAAGWIISETALKKTLAPAECRWCATNAFDLAVRSAFHPTLAPSPSGVLPVDLVSGLVGFVGLPLVMLGLDAWLAWRDGVFAEAWLVDVLLMVEATVSAMAVNQTVKFSVGRARPYSVGASPELLAQASDPADANLSFYSGHSSFSFALAASAATIAGLRGYRNAWVVWAVGMPLAATTAILRLGADKHWTTDVLIGGAVGTAFGILGPLLLHGRIGPVTAQVTVQGDGLAVAGRF